MKIFESKIPEKILLPFLEMTGISYIDITEQTTIQSLLEKNKASDFSKYTVVAIMDMFPCQDNILSFVETKVIPNHFCEFCGCYPCECDDSDYIEIEQTNRMLLDQFYIKN